MTIGLVGRKCGMTRIFTDAGVSVPVTVIEVDPNRITQIKTLETDGYQAIQITTGERRESRVTNAQKGHFAKAGVAAGRLVQEFRATEADLEGRAACTGRGVIYFCWCGLSWKGRRQSAGKQTECRNTGRNAIWNGHGRSAECKKTGRSRYGTRRSREDGAPEYLTLRFRCNPGKRAAAHQGPFEDQVCGEMGEERKIGG